jgi:hypothetical protein
MPLLLSSGYLRGRYYTAKKMSVNKFGGCFSWLLQSQKNLNANSAKRANDANFLLSFAKIRSIRASPALACGASVRVEPIP